MGNVNCCDSIKLEGRNDSSFRSSTSGLLRKPAPQCPAPAKHLINPSNQNYSGERTCYVTPKEKYCEKQRGDLIQNGLAEPSDQDRGLNASQTKDKIGRTLDNGKRRVKIPVDLVSDDSCRQREHIQSCEIAKLTGTKFSNTVSEKPESMQWNNSKTPRQIDRHHVVCSTQVLQ